MLQFGTEESGVAVFVQGDEGARVDYRAVGLEQQVIRDGESGTTKK